MESKSTNEIYKNDKCNFEDFVNNKTSKFNYNSFKRLTLSELAFKRSFKNNRICSFTPQQLNNMAEYPERYGEQILRVCNFMYLKSGYFKRLIDYFANSAIARWNVDTQAKSAKFFKVNQNTLRNNYVNFVGECSNLKLENIINDIFKKMYLNDVVYAYVEENEYDGEVSYYFLDPRYCEIRRLINGNVYAFSVNRSLLNGTEYEDLPDGLKKLLEISVANDQLDYRTEIPLENSLCLKYNNIFTYAYPPFFSMIKDLLSIDDYKDIAKTKAINDAYKLLVLNIPTDDETGQMQLGEEIITDFTMMAKDVIQENIGVLPIPMQAKAIEFSGASANDKDYVSDATDNMYKNVGVAQSIISGSSSGSELKQSIINDNGDIFRIYRIIESWVNLRMKLKNYIYPYYSFVMTLLDITIYNHSDVIDQELKLAQVSLPNKQRLLASAGINPSKLFGNNFIENVVFKDMFEQFTPLQTSYTQSAKQDDNKGGRTELKDDEKAESTIAGDKVDSNDKDNRV